MGTLWNLRPLAGVMLRYEVCLVLRDAGRALAIAEIISVVRGDGFELPDNPNKAVSDALRWELRRQRVDRLRRGLYTSGRLPRSSEFRMRRTIAEAPKELGLPKQNRNSLQRRADSGRLASALAPQNRNSLEGVGVLEAAATRHFSRDRPSARRGWREHDHGGVRTRRGRRSRRRTRGWPGRSQSLVARTCRLGAGTG